MNDPRAELEEMAQALQRGRSKLAAVEDSIAALEPEWDRLHGERTDLRLAIKAIEQGMETTRRAYAIKQKLGEMGIEYSRPMVVLTDAYRGKDAWFLVAVAADGTGLYQHDPRKGGRHWHKSYAVFGDEDDPRALRAHLSRTTRMQDAGLAAHMERGTGSFGAGSGAVKPLPPPDGGRWRWIKVDEQALLTVGADA